MIPTAERKRPGLRGFLLRRLPRTRLEEPATRAVAFDPFRPPRTSLAEVALKAQVGDHVACLPSVAVRGKIFRAGPVVESAPSDESLPKDQPGLFGEGTGITIERKLTFEFLYDFLYPPVGEESESVPGFAELHRYQRDGIQFLVERTSALLADDMGLGKTAQCSVAIAILRKQERLRRALVICPRSVILQWQAEARRWGGLSAKIVDGSPHTRKLIWKHQPGLMLATPHIVLRDAETLKDVSLDLVVCDDVSMLKNPGQITTAIRELRRERSWCLNGTPLENKPEDLLNTMEYVCPGLFTYSERQNAPSKAVIDERIKPYFLRRKKTDHLDLPDKVSGVPAPASLEGAQLTAYRDAELREWKALQESGMNVSKVHIFSVINALIRLCNFHPPSGKSAKSDLLEDELETLLASPENKAVVFAHDVEALRFLERRLAKHRPVLYHGGLSQNERQRTLDRFKGENPLFLGSVKACGRGLNLQHASYVFHFDRTWNPVDELQAEDRCWRQGQTRRVFVRRYIVQHTIEERIDRVLARKKGLFDLYIDSHAVGPENSDAVASEKWSLEEFMEVLRPDEKKDG